MDSMSIYTRAERCLSFSASRTILDERLQAFDVSMLILDVLLQLLHQSYKVVHPSHQVFCEERKKRETWHFWSIAELCLPTNRRNHRGWLKYRRAAMDCPADSDCSDCCCDAHVCLVYGSFLDLNLELRGEEKGRKGKWDEKWLALCGIEKIFTSIWSLITSEPKKGLQGIFHSPL